MSAAISAVMCAVTCAVTSAGLFAQTTTPLPPIDSVRGRITLNVAEFASVPEMNGQAARMMLLVDEPGTRRLFVNDMRGPIYSLSYDGRSRPPIAPTCALARRRTDASSFSTRPTARSAC